MTLQRILDERFVVVAMARNLLRLLPTIPASRQQTLLLLLLLPRLHICANEIPNKTKTKKQESLTLFKE
eukprot:m.62500 g.62500  ORF g.62500 m.62500 type:complete len:69 (+) comp23165_c0_seq2:126-332(+)